MRLGQLRTIFAFENHKFESPQPVLRETESSAYGCPIRITEEAEIHGEKGKTRRTPVREYILDAIVGSPDESLW